MIRVRCIKGQLILPVRVTPRGGKDVLLPFEVGDTELKIKVSAPPEEGKANAAVIQLLADILLVPKSWIAITNGEKSRHKQVGIMLPDIEDGNTILATLGQALNVSESIWYQISPS